MIQQSAQLTGVDTAYLTSEEALSLGRGSYAPEGHPDNTASVTAVVPPLSIIPQTPVVQLVNTMAPFLPSPIPNVVATLTNPNLVPDDTAGIGLLYAGNYKPGNPVGMLTNTQTDTGPATAVTTGGFPTPSTVGEITAGGNMTLPMIPGSAPGSTTVPAQVQTDTVLGTPFTMKQLLIAAAAFLILR